MATKFQVGYGDWIEYRKLPGVSELDFHFGADESAGSFWENMEQAKDRTIQALKRCFDDPGVQYVLFTHGWSTSGPGRMSARSQIRGVMRSPAATPYIDRKNCIQHDSVFVAALKKNAKEKSD